MRKKSIATKMTALFTAAAVGITTVGCGAGEQTASKGSENNASTAIDTIGTDEDTAQTG